MSDITPITSSKKISPIQPIKQQKSLESFTQEEIPYIESSEPIDPECLKQIEKDLANHPHQAKQLEKNASALKEMTQGKSAQEDLDPIKQELENLHKLPPEQLQDLSNQLKKNLSQLQTTLLELKKQKKVDAEKADFILDGITEFSAKDFHKLTQQDKQKLHNTLDVLEKKITDLAANKQIDPHKFNILILFLVFAKAQMDQNDKAMLAGIDQTKVKTTQLELQAQKVKDNANESTQGQHMSTCKSILLGIGVALAIGLFAFFTFGAGLAVAAGAGIVAGATVGISVYSAADPNAKASGWLTDTGPDGNKITHLQTMLNYFNTETQKLSSQLGSTEKLLVEDTSTRSTQMSQQAGQAISELGEVMKSR